MTTDARSAGRRVSALELQGGLPATLSRAFLRLWCWREVSTPAILVGAAYLQGGLALALAVGSLLAGLAIVIAAVRPDVLTAALSRCSERSLAVDRHLHWPRVCHDLGWYRRLDRDAVLVPELIRWSEGADRVEVSLRPLPEQAERSWPQMADSLRRLLAGETVEWRESRGALTLLISKRGLPSQLLWEAGVGDAGCIALGWRQGGGLLALEPSRTPHVLLAGATGSGKGGAIRAAVAGALTGGWQVVVLDPKESGEFGWLDRLGVSVLCSVGEQTAALEALDAIRQRRQAVVKQYGVDTWRDLPAGARVGWQPVLIVLDEASDLLVASKGKGEEQRARAALQHTAGELIAQFARKGRSAGIHLLIAIQRPDTAQLGDQGGALRNNLAARLALGGLDADGLRMLGISSGDPIAATLDGTPGRGVCVGFAPAPQPGACQVAWLDQRRALAEVIPTAPQGLVAIEPFRAIDELWDGGVAEQQGAST